MNRLKPNRSMLAMAVATALLKPNRLGICGKHSQQRSHRRYLSHQLFRPSQLRHVQLRRDDDLRPVADPLQGISEVRTWRPSSVMNRQHQKPASDTQYGVGNWHVTDVQLKFYTNFGHPRVYRPTTISSTCLTMVPSIFH